MKSKAEWQKTYIQFLLYRDIKPHKELVFVRLAPLVWDAGSAMISLSVKRSPVALLALFGKHTFLS